MRFASDQRDEWLDSAFDRKYGTDTGGIIDDMSQLGVDSVHGQNAFGYEGIQLPVFRRILADLHVTPNDYVFIDFGSGKGRAVMMAAEQHFAAVHGVEFSPVLHEIARRNCAQFRRRNPGSSPISLYCQDAAEFQIPDGNLVCFFYNPFNEQVMRKVLDNIAVALEKSPRELLIAYRNPSCAGLLDAYPFLSPTASNSTYRVYRARRG
ncbi:MAG: class I SAM-dependent methyltransferase [Myxococcota bacterium]